MNPSKVMLIILDGWGLNKKYPGNAIELAHTPYFDKLWKERPAATLEASGESVGLPEGQMGTSEVNHFTIGAGRVMFQDLVRVNHSIDDESFFKNAALLGAFDHVKKNNSKLHLFGLISDGGVHSHLDHFKAILKAAKKANVQEVYLHAFTDGRDTAPRGGRKYMAELEATMRELGVGKVATLVGRYFAMDRDKNWDRTNVAFKLITELEGQEFSSVDAALEASYNSDVTDEFVKPAFITPSTGEKTVVADGDAVFFVNFRNDRPRQLTEVFLKHGFNNLYFATMTQYHPLYEVEVAFPPQSLETTLGQTLSDAGKKQLRITETEKFAHVTFFLNCKHEDAYEGEDRVMFDSYSDIPTHDHRPEMRASDIATELVKTAELETHDAIFVNFCNADMVGHTGNIPAAIKACEAVDEALKKVVPAALEHGYTVLITADHGNADEMLDEETGDMITSHSLNIVPFILVSNEEVELVRKSGTLIDIAPTMLTLMGLEIPRSMTGESFVK
ncbi:MAG: 2,3-bisphosphoglycerate-independent phosphoglycerate mutase [Pseudomonadales bacterium]|nr:2,3-bisphosphoglycerate-independent phosphoglycerate mutase [Candidatus Woesebacteria bacterium]MCB9801189.1 2,3-bisphosphoglycerate-independent phosphoglycerate mutase [Pseudomonadales bacterium]